ncbi:MAG: ketopantoate reductase family protein [Thermoplasmata archaeon]|nr:ketopantoate reductase family protein [Thermoplasmata archaeon]
MKVLIFGAGAIGSFVGAMLSKHHAVTLVGRKPHVEKINAEGLKIEGLVESVVNVPASETIPPGDWDVVFLTTKAYDTKDAVREILCTLEKGTIVSMQNGLSNLETIEHEVRASGKTFEVGACITSMGVTFLGPGRIRFNGHGTTVVGCGRRRVAETISQMLTTSGISTEVVDNILHAIWVKGVVNSAINPLTVVFNVKNGMLVSNGYLKDLLTSVAAESEAIGKAAGFIGPGADCVGQTIKVAEQTAENYSSMLQDVRKGKRTEIMEINGYIVEVARRNGFAAPLNKFLINAVLAIQSCGGGRG